MSKLEELALDLRAARPWPAAVFKLPRLRHVELPVKVLDEQLRKLPHLESLQIEGVQGKPHTAPLPAWLWKLRLKRLDLLYFALRAFPDGLLGMTTLEELQFQRAGHGDQRLRVPAEIARLTRLRKLGLCCVDATGVPFDAFRELRKLELSHAKIDRLPDGFGKLRKLTDLKIEESAIDALPDSLGGCRALEHLVLMKLPLTALPASVGDLRALRSVWIDGTPIDALPESLGRCKQLESAWVTETRITE